MPNLLRKRVKTDPTRSSKPKKRKFYGNQYTKKIDISGPSTSAEKLKQSVDVKISDSSHGYRLINFVSVFTTLSQLIICKLCKSEVKFSETSPRGLGFKIIVQCQCKSDLIHSGPLVKNAYEINRRIIFVMRLLGVGLQGINTFCALMDISKGFSKSLYQSTVSHISDVVDAVFKDIAKKAVEEERSKSVASEDSPIHLTVSGDGSWKKRGFSSLFGVATLIGENTKKVIDLVVKSSYCKSCEYWKDKKDSEDYREWIESHEDQCTVNHHGSAGKMEVDAIKEMFARSETLYGVKYTNYIGDGDTKTFKALLDFNPYDNNPTIKKKECVGHVQKRMGTRLRAVKKSVKGLGGKGQGKLTDKLIKDLTIYYGLAIRRNCNSVDDMEKSIWATFYHKCSTDAKPQHESCPPGSDSWCDWRRAEANGDLSTFTHKDPPLANEVQEAIRPIYEDLSSRELLERCLGGHTQNSNESFNSTVWMFAPKHIYCGPKIVEIAAKIAACIFNEGYNSILQIFQAMGIIIGPQCHIFAQARDRQRRETANKRVSDATKEARRRKREDSMVQNQLFEEAEGLLYGPGMAE